MSMYFNSLSVLLIHSSHFTFNTHAFYSSLYQQGPTVLEILEFYKFVSGLKEIGLISVAKSSKVWGQ